MLFRSETIDEYLRTNFYHNETIERLLGKYELMVNQNELTSFAAAHKLLDTYFKTKTE